MGEQVISLQGELLAAYTDVGFQAKLQELQARAGMAWERYTVEHSELFRSAVRNILPKYGLAEGRKGALQMTNSFKRFGNNAVVQRNRFQLNRMLGLIRPESVGPA